MERHGIRSETRHRALPDAQVLAKFWSVLRAQWPAERLEAALETVSRRPVLPPQVPASIVDDLPESSGVYRFFGEGDALIYVGKAKNIRERVLEHFGGASPRRQVAAPVGADPADRLDRDGRRARRAAARVAAGARTEAGLQPAAARRRVLDLDRRRRRCARRGSWTSTPAKPDDDGDAFGLYRTAKQAKAALLKLARDAAPVPEGARSRGGRRRLVLRPPGRSMRGRLRRRRAAGAPRRAAEARAGAATTQELALSRPGRHPRNEHDGLHPGARRRPVAVPRVDVRATIPTRRRRRVGASTPMPTGS